MINMRYLFSLFIILLANLSFAAQVLVLVDGKAITSVDVNKRIEAIKLASPNLPVDKEFKIQTLNSLVSEELFRNEAKRLKVTISDEEINSHFKTLKQDFNFSEDQLKKLISNNSLRQQVESQLLWNKLVSAVFYAKVKVSDAEVQEEQKIRSSIIKEVTFKQILFRESDKPKIDNIRKAGATCGNIDNLSKAQALPKPFLNSLPFSDLNTELQTVIKNLPIDKLSDILDLGTGKQVIILCNKTTEENISNAHQIRQELGSRKINAEAQKYLAELKKRIYVEYVSPIE